MSKPQVNGDSPASSAFLSHLTSFPVVSDSISTFKSNPYGAKSLDITSTLSHRLSPYLSKPYQYVSPYVSRADSIGEFTLCTLETRIPSIKKPTNELYADSKSLVFLPISKGFEGKDHVLSTYNSELKKVGGQGVVPYGKAAVSTSFIVGGEAFNWVVDFLSQKQAQTKELAAEKTDY